MDAINELATEKLPTIDEAGTTASNYKVGIGALNDGEGWNVVLDKANSYPVKNFRITDVNPYHQSKYQSLGVFTLRWNYAGLKGVPNYSHESAIDITGVDGTVNTALVVTENELIGYYLKSTAFSNAIEPGYKIKITGNEPTDADGKTTIYLSSSGGYGQESVNTSTTYASIVNLCDGFKVKIIEYDTVNSSESLLNIMEYDYSGDIIDNQMTQIVIPINGFNCKVKIATVSSGMVNNNYSELTDGNYDPDPDTPATNPRNQDIVVGYYADNYFSSNLPYLNSSSVGLAVSAIPFGFIYQLTGTKWSGGASGETPNSGNSIDKQAHQIEFGVSPATPVDFGGAETITRLIDYPSMGAGSFADFQTLSGQFYISARPVQNNQVVGVQTDSQAMLFTGSTDITSEELLVSKDFNIQPFYASNVGKTDTPMGGFEYYIRGFDFFGSDGSAQGTTVSPDTVMSAINGSNGDNILSTTDGNRKFIINGAIAINNWVGDGISGQHIILCGLTALEGDLPTGNNSNGQEVGNLRINTDKRGRRIERILNLPQSKELSTIVVEVNNGMNVSQASPGIVRVYQDNAETQADSIVVENSPLTDVQSTDVQIVTSNGDLTLIVDAYDPTGTGDSAPNNHCAIAGNVKVYGHNFVATSTSNPLNNTGGGGGGVQG